MSLYNMLFGTNPMAGVLLQALGITSADVPRFRDCYLGEDGQIVVYTRTGGGNRDFYESEDDCRRNYPEHFDDVDSDSEPSGPWNSDLRALPGFVEDEDDDFDCTYAYFRFAPPEEWKPLIDALRELGAGTMQNPGERFRQLIADMEAKKETPEVARALDVGRQILAPVIKHFEGGRDQP